VVPEDRAATREQELAEVLAAVDEVDREAGHLHEQGEGQARTRRQEAGEEAERILARAHEDAERERASAAATRRREIEHEMAADLAEAEAEQARVRTTAARHRDELASRVVARILDVAHGTTG
jgi:type IV secretory pathway VirJ component